MKKLKILTALALAALLLGRCATEQEDTNDSDNRPRTHEVNKKHNKAAQSAAKHNHKTDNKQKKTAQSATEKASNRHKKAASHKHKQAYQQKPTNAPKSFARNSNQLGLNKAQARFAHAWHYTNGRRFKMMPLDHLGRAQGSHIQLSLNQLPTAKRRPYLTIRPSGWHNYKFHVTKNGRRYTSWLFNRGHLIGYQFCGINQARGNMITQTAYVNQGGLTGMNSYNPQGQLFYENRLRKWLNAHPQDKLDYIVMPVYRGQELVPRQIKFIYTGLARNGSHIRINLGSKNRVHASKTTLTLNNYSPVASINYATGTAQIIN